MIEIKEFIDKHVFVVSKKYADTALSYFTAITSGKAEDFTTLAQYDLDLEKIYTNQEDFETIKRFRETTIEDPLVKRQIELLFLSYQ
jgi:peptidyl-dipeptidase A